MVVLSRRYVAVLLIAEACGYICIQRASEKALKVFNGVESMERSRFGVRDKDFPG